MSCNIPNCIRCSASNVCAVCTLDANLYRPSPNGGACLTCDLARANMGGCISCNATNSCGLCANGLQLFNLQNSGMCISCPIQNCESCGILASNLTNPICTKCAIGYSVTPLANMCIQCLFPCDTCKAQAGPNNCATCQLPQFFPQANADGTCIRNLIPGCVAPNTVNSSLCGQCGSGFFLSNDSARCNWNCPLNC